jgi:hypothetical protein
MLRKVQPSKRSPSARSPKRLHSACTTVSEAARRALARSFSSHALAMYLAAASGLPNRIWALTETTR